ncbi:DUF937 domain-containing protein [Salinarimonas soli]|uniref:DUF937 domain-containing protein n=1 Tax=Salinarimonas soli TaxID=1638099 RepID=UPI001661BA7C|nr:DUF937 domain-containing protein [Salinarimonas soli]
MLTFLDIWKSAQAVSTLETAGRQFGLTPEQARTAAAALTPAFLMALQRNALQSPGAFADLMRLTGTGSFASLLSQGFSAFTPQRRAEADDAVGRLFGPEVSRLVAQQTAAIAGIAPEAMRQLMPLATGLMFGGLFQSAAERGSTNVFAQMAEMARAAPPRPEPPRNPFAEMMRPWFAAPAPPEPSRRAPAAQPTGRNPWEDLFGIMFGLTPKPDAPPPPVPAAAPDPLGDMMRMMMGLPSPQAPPPPEPEPDPAPDAAQAWGQALRAGQEAQKRHLEALQTIFDRAWRPAAREAEG